MTQTVFCHEGQHTDCLGQVSKWSADPGDTIVATNLIESDGVGVLVVCQCPCHAQEVTA